MRRDLTPENFDDKFSYLVEECGEVLQAIGKYQRFGPMATDKKTGLIYNNTADLLSELSDLERAISFVREELS